jgi:cold shock CspA family protein
MGEVKPLLRSHRRFEHRHRGEVVTDGPSALLTESGESERESVEDEGAGGGLEAEEGNDVFVSWSGCRTLERLEPGENARFSLEHRSRVLQEIPRRHLDCDDAGVAAAPRREASFRGLGR